MIHIRSVGVRIQIRTQLLSSLIDKFIQPNLGVSEMMAQSDSRQPTSFARPDQLDPNLPMNPRLNQRVTALHQSLQQNDETLSRC